MPCMSETTAPKVHSQSKVGLKVCDGSRHGHFFPSGFLLKIFINAKESDQPIAAGEWSHSIERR